MKMILNLIALLLLASCSNSGSVRQTTKSSSVNAINGSTAIIKEHQNINSFDESTPFVLNNRLYLFSGEHPNSFTDPTNRLMIIDDQGNIEVVATGYTLGCAMVYNNQVYIFATNNDLKEIDMFQNISGSWVSSTVLTAQNDEEFFNSSVTETDSGFTIAYEIGINNNSAFTFKTATSTDLVTWTRTGLPAFANYYSACPTIRYFNGTYYATYLAEFNGDFVTRIAKTTDLINWTLSPNIVLAPDADEGINASDMDFTEFNGETVIYYIDGDQQTWGYLRRAHYAGSLQSMLESFF